MSNTAIGNSNPMNTKRAARKFSMTRLFSWYSSDPLFAWFTLLQVVSFLILGLTLAIGTRLSIKQSKQILGLEKDLSDARRKQTEAESELIKLRNQIGPRQLNREVFWEALRDQPKAPVQILYLKDDQDSMEFAQEIANDLNRAGWKVTERAPISPSQSDVPTAMTVGGQPSGITVVTHSLSEDEAAASLNQMNGKEWAKTPWTVLAYALRESMGMGQASSHESVPEGTLRVVVAPKPVR